MTLFITFQAIVRLEKSPFFSFFFKFSNNPEKLNLLLPLTIEKMYVNAKEGYLIFTTRISVSFVTSIEKLNPSFHVHIIQDILWSPTIFFYFHLYFQLILVC